MNCPSCHSDMRVMDSRKQAGSTVRRRECLSCGHRLSTMEVVVAQRADRPAKATKANKADKTAEQQRPKAKPPKSVKIARAVRKTKQYDDFSSNGDEDYGYIDDLKETGLDLKKKLIHRP